MAKQGGKILDIILKTIDDVQKKNQASTREETADPTVFDLLKDKLGNLDKKIQNKRVKKGKAPVSILDLIKNQIEAAQKQNKRDKEVPTADPAIFERIIKKVEDKPKKVASTGLKRIIENFHLDVSDVNPAILQQVQRQYETDLKRMDQQYAEAIHKLIARSR